MPRTPREPGHRRAASALRGAAARLGALAACAWLCAGCSPAARGPTAPERAPIAAEGGLPGACVEPTADGRRRLGADASDGELRVERTVDLDGDGVADPFVAHASFCGSSGCVWQLYVARGGCAHWVGELYGIWPLPREDRSHGLADLEVAARNGCAGAARTESRASFDGVRYGITTTRECHCPAAGADPATDDDTVDPEAACDPWAPATRVDRR